MKKLLALLLCGTVLLAACGQKEEVQTSDTPVEISQSDVGTTESDSSGETTEDSSDESSSAAKYTGETVAYDEVHEFENTSSAKGKLDDEGIYRYDFLNEDDAVYDYMSYQEIEDILPVHEQKPIEVTLGTNFVIEGKHFNFKDLTPNSLYKTLNVDATGSSWSYLDSPLSNGNRRSNNIGFKDAGFSSGIDYMAINPEKRDILFADARITELSVHVNDGEPSKDFGEIIAYEGINFYITRTQFIENVKINNPVYKDRGFNEEKTYTKGRDVSTISYLLDGEDSRGDSEVSYVEFTFTGEILTSVKLVCTLDYLGIEVQ